MRELNTYTKMKVVAITCFVLPATFPDITAKFNVATAAKALQQLIILTEHQPVRCR